MARGSSIMAWVLSLTALGCASPSFCGSLWQAAALALVVITVGIATELGSGGVCMLAGVGVGVGVGVNLEVLGVVMVLSFVVAFKVASGIRAREVRASVQVVVKSLPSLMALMQVLTLAALMIALLVSGEEISVFVSLTNVLEV